MARPRFSEMLINRRRQLGLSVKQASNVLRLREDVLIAFEEGDFEAMPKSGYAQGMLSSYARYLGLNPRQVTNQFSADLADWEHGGSGRSMAGRGGSRRRRGDDPSYETPQNGRYEGSRGLLPTSGGYAGDIYGYATTSQAHSRGQRPSPLVNQSRSRPDDGSRGGARAGEGHRYSGRDLSTYSSGRDGQRTMRYRAQADRSGYASRYRGNEGFADQSARDRVSVRRVAPSDYTDDLQYGDALPYEAASTRSGRRSSRNIARVDRPNIQRRSSGRSSGRDSRGGSRGRAPEPRRGGVIGVIEAFFSDPRRTLALVLVVAVAVLTVVIISSVGSCVSKNVSSGRTVSVTTSSSEGNGSSKSESSSTSKTEETEKAAADAAAAKKTKEDTAAKTETKVEVSVGDGEVSWVEIENDGKSLVAEQITGPWKQSYVVTGQFTIQVSDTTAVTVTKNGEMQKFDNKTSGIGTITIVGTKATTSSTSTGATSGSSGTNGAADATKETSAEASGSSSSGTTGSTTTSGQPSSTSDDSEDESAAGSSTAPSRSVSTQTSDEDADATDGASASNETSGTRSSGGTSSSSSYSYFSNDE